MSSSRNRKLNSGLYLCVYCGKIPGTTVDHVIPRAVLPEKIPKGTIPITVPCCPDCNREKAKDDEFLRDILSIDSHTQGHTAVSNIYDKFIAAAERNNSEVARMLSTATIPRDIFTKTGTLVGNFSTVQVAPERFDCMLMRIVRGLYWNAYNQRIPDIYKFDIRQVLAPDIERELQKWEVMLNKPLLSAARNSYFLQGHVLAEDDPFHVVWLLVFYGGYTFLVAVSKAE